MIDLSKATAGDVAEVCGAYDWTPTIHEEAGDDMEQILLACNCHDGLLEACKNLVGYMDRNVNEHGDNFQLEKLMDHVSVMRIEIAKAEGRGE